MITKETANEIATLTEELERVKLCINHSSECNTRLVVICVKAEEKISVNIDTEMLIEILNTISNRYTARLDELNYLAIQEAQNNEVLNESDN